MHDILKQSYIENQPVSFSYKKKYLISYGHNEIENSAGQFNGKLYGYGYLNGKFWPYFIIAEKDKYYAIHSEDLNAQV